MGSLRVLSVLALLSATTLSAQGSPVPPNPEIDIDGYLRAAKAAALERASHRVSEEDFIRMSREPGTLILDARSRQKYDELHVKGAVHLGFPDITIDSLRALIPDKRTRVLIYCNNNFRNAQGPFPSKLPAASLNHSTYTALYSYGYRNVWELGPLIDIRATKLPFEPKATLEAVQKVR
jgi:phage shock protein E